VGSSPDESSPEHAETHDAGADGERATKDKVVDDVEREDVSTGGPDEQFARGRAVEYI
jgi:hypothetical protein